MLFKMSKQIKFFSLLVCTLFIFNNFIMSNAEKLISTDFEVFGRVQGVFFRKYTQKQAQELGLKGWCRNTDNGTVQGVIEGNESKVNEMKRWLEKTGSPQSRIDKAVFHNQHDITKLSYDSFTIRS